MSYVEIKEVRGCVIDHKFTCDISMCRLSVETGKSIAELPKGWGILVLHGTRQDNIQIEVSAHLCAADFLRIAKEIDPSLWFTLGRNSRTTLEVPEGLDPVR